MFFSTCCGKSDLSVKGFLSELTSMKVFLAGSTAIDPPDVTLLQHLRPKVDSNCNRLTLEEGWSFFHFWRKNEQPIENCILKSIVYQLSFSLYMSYWLMNKNYSNIFHHKVTSSLNSYVVMKSDKWYIFIFIEEFLIIYGANIFLEI